MSDWNAHIACAPGDSHLRDGRASDDAARWARAKDGLLMLAVADGLSQARYGATGAALAAEALIAEAERALAVREPMDAASWTALLAGVVDASCLRVRGALQALCGPQAPDEGGATVALCVIRQQWCAAAAVGDCFVLAGRDDGSLHVLLRPWPDATQPVSSTTTLLSPDRRVRSIVVRDRGLRSVVLSTDGLASIALSGAGGPEERVHAPFIAPLLQHLADGNDPHEVSATLLNAADVRARTGDDRTLLAAVRS